MKHCGASFLKTDLSGPVKRGRPATGPQSSEASLFFAGLRVVRRLLCLCLCLSAVRLGAADDPHPPAAEKASFRVLDGFDVDLFASEVDGVVKPIQIRFDPDGRLWVSGSVTYPQIKPGDPARDQVVVLEDTDGDGRADKTTVFADDLLMPTGLELGDGGLYVGSSTELLHLRDTDGDGKADDRRVVLRGFGTGDTHQTVNSFTWGPSGELLMSQGLHANSRIETPWGIEELRQAGVFRLWPRRLRLDPFWTGAMGAHNPFGNAFDRWGQPFVFAGNGHGVHHLTQAMIRTDHFLEQRSIWNQGRKFGGADFVENSHFPAANQGEAVSGGYLQNSVERFRFTDAASGFTAERLPPLIESTDTAFRVVDARFGPDGALYLCDWYNPVIGHYQTSFRHPDRDKSHGRIWRVTAKGRPLVPRKKLTQLPTPELVALLASPERWYRQMAKRVLADRPTADVTAALAAWTASPSATDEHALFEALGVYASHEVVEAGLLSRLASAKAPEARAYAAHVAGIWADRLTRPLDFLARLAADPSPRVRLEAVVACSYVADARAVETAAIAADLPWDPVIDYAFTQCVHALRPHWQDALARGDLKFDGQSARLAAFNRVDRSAGTVFLAANRLRRIGEVALDEATQRGLLQVVAEAGGPKELGVLLSARAHTTGTNYDSASHLRSLGALLVAARERDFRPEGDLAALLKPLLAQDRPALRDAAVRLAGAWQIAAVRDRVAADAVDTAASPGLRTAAIDALGMYGGEPDREILRGLAATAPDAGSRRAALLRLVPLDPSAAARAAVVWLADTQDPATTTEVFKTFLLRRDGPPALAAALAGKTIPKTAAETGLAVLGASGRRDAALALALETSAGVPAAAGPARFGDPATLAAEVRSLGDIARGRDIFMRPGLACHACHSVDGTPGKVGPDLSPLGTAQTVEFVIGAILEPQKEVKEGFMAHEVVAADGTTYQGYLRGETAEEITLLDHLSGKIVRLRASQIAERRQLGSLMPDGIADPLNRAEFCDLVKFLSQLGKK